MVLTHDEIAILLALVAGIDPNKYKDSKVKAMIYKAKAAKEYRKSIVRLLVIE